MLNLTPFGTGTYGASPRSRPRAGPVGGAGPHHGFADLRVAIVIDVAGADDGDVELVADGDGGFAGAGDVDLGAAALQAAQVDIAGTGDRDGQLAGAAAPHFQVAAAAQVDRDGVGFDALDVDVARTAQVDRHLLAAQGVGVDGAGAAQGQAVDAAGLDDELHVAAVDARVVLDGADLQHAVFHHRLDQGQQVVVRFDGEGFSAADAQFHRAGQGHGHAMEAADLARFRLDAAVAFDIAPGPGQRRGRQDRGGGGGQGEQESEAAAGQGRCGHGRSSCKSG